MDLQRFSIHAVSNADATGKALLILTRAAEKWHWVALSLEAAAIVAMNFFGRGVVKRV